VKSLANAFIDTTILCNALNFSSKEDQNIALAALGCYKKTEIPYYALRELKAGPMSYWILAHNYLATESSIEEARSRISKAGAFKPRQKTLGLEIIINGYDAVMQLLKEKAKSNYVPEFDEKTELENYIARKILKAWYNRNNIANLTIQPLSCFTDSELEFEGRNLRFEDKRFGCRSDVTCGAAVNLKNQQADLDTILEVLRPPKEKLETQEKQETTGRRSALKEISKKAPKDFPHKKCRSIGDAYFCIMAPNDSDILTTNKIDFEPLAKALRKNLVVPSKNSE
jgi:hypothetical protein